MQNSSRAGSWRLSSAFTTFLNRDVSCRSGTFRNFAKSSWLRTEWCINFAKEPSKS